MLSLDPKALDAMRNYPSSLNILLHRRGSFPYSGETQPIPDLHEFHGISSRRKNSGRVEFECPVPPPNSKDPDPEAGNYGDLEVENYPDSETGIFLDPEVENYPNAEAENDPNAEAENDPESPTDEEELLKIEIQPRKISTPSVLRKNRGQRRGPKKTVSFDSSASEIASIEDFFQRKTSAAQSIREEPPPGFITPRNLNSSGNLNSGFEFRRWTDEDLIEENSQMNPAAKNFRSEGDLQSLRHPAAGAAVAAVGAVAAGAAAEAAVGKAAEAALGEATGEAEQFRPARFGSESLISGSDAGSGAAASQEQLDSSRASLSSELFRKFFQTRVESQDQISENSATADKETNF